MEVSLEELAEMLCKSGNTPRNPGEFLSSSDPLHGLVGTRCVIRTRISGVSIGVIDAITVAESTTVRLSDAIRIWSWTDSAFTLSELARTGAKCRVDDHPDGVVITETGMEILPVSTQAWDYIQDHKSGKLG